MVLPITFSESNALRPLFALLTFLTGFSLTCCQPDQNTPANAWPARFFGRPKPFLFVPDTAVYALVKYFVENPVIKWEQGDSIAPFGYGRIMFDRLSPAHYTGPELFNGDIAGLYFDGILNAGDTLFYHSQIKGSNDFELKAEKLPECIVIPTDSLLLIRSRGGDTQHWTFQKYGHSVYGVSMPLFSKDYNVATLTFMHWCGGLCAEYFTVTIRRHKKQWYLVKILSTAQS